MSQVAGASYFAFPGIIFSLPPLSLGRSILL